MAVKRLSDLCVYNRCCKPRYCRPSYLHVQWNNSAAICCDEMKSYIMESDSGDSAAGRVNLVTDHTQTDGQRQRERERERAEQTGRPGWLVCWENGWIKHEPRIHTVSVVVARSVSLSSNLPIFVVHSSIRRQSVAVRQRHVTQLLHFSSVAYLRGGHGSLSPPPRDVGKKCALPVIKCLMDYSTV